MKKEVKEFKIRRKHLLFVISAPSGTGKTTLCKALLEIFPDIRHSISFTTRKPREGEEDGKDYFFVSKDKFLKMVENGEFVEWAIVYENYYGTSWKHLVKLLKEGDVLLDIDIQGAKKIKAFFSNSVSIFILPPSFEVLWERLIKRKGINNIKLRMEKAKEEIKYFKDYDYVVRNDNLKTTLDILSAIIIAERNRVSAISVEGID